MNNVLDLDINIVKLMVLHYKKYPSVLVGDLSLEEFEIEEEPEILLKKILTDDFKFKNAWISKIEFFDNNDNLLAESFTWTYNTFVDFLKKRIFLDSNLESLHEGDYVEFVNSGKKGIVNRLGVGTTQKLVSVMVNNHVYTALPKNIRKINLDLLKEKETEKIDLLDAPYFIKIDIDGKYYSYACFDKVSVGDYVMVTGRAEHMIHKVREVIPNYKMTNKNIVTQEVKCVCHFDFAAYENRIKDRHKKNIQENFENFVVNNIKTKDELKIFTEILKEHAEKLDCPIFINQKDVTKFLQAEGIKKAKKNNVVFGSPCIPIPENWEKVYNDWINHKITAKKAMSQLGLKKSTFYKFVKNVQEEK